MTLYRGGFPFAPHDVAKKLNIEGYGEIEVTPTGIAI